MDNMASPLSLYCPTVLLKWFIMSFNLENERSEVATVTGRVRNKTRAVQTSLNVEVTAGWLYRQSTCTFACHKVKCESENKASHAAQYFIQYSTPTTSLKSVGLVKFLATMTQS